MDLSKVYAIVVEDQLLCDSVEVISWVVRAAKVERVDLLWVLAHKLFKCGASSALDMVGLNGQSIDTWMLVRSHDHKCAHFISHAITFEVQMFNTWNQWDNTGKCLGMLKRQLIVINLEHLPLMMPQNWKWIALKPFAEHFIHQLDMVFAVEKRWLIKFILDFFLELFHAIKFLFLVFEQENWHIAFSQFVGI